MGELAETGGFTYSDLPPQPNWEPSERIAPALQPPSDAPWQLGSIAANEQYRPLGNDPWTNTMAQAPKPAPPPDRPNPLIPFSAYRSLPPRHTAGEVAAQQIVEQGPLGFGLGLATGGMLKGLGASPFTRGTIGGTVASAEPSEAEAARWKLYPIGGIATSDTPANLAKLNRHVPTKDIFEKTIQPHDIPEGSWLTPLVGDRSRSGELLTHVGERELRDPVWMQGGYQFMPEWQKDKIAWGSDKAPTSTIGGRVKGFGTDNPGVYGVYTPMSPLSIDASHHMSDTLSQMMHMDKKNLSTTAIEKFDDKFKSLDPDFPGVTSSKLQGYLRRQSMTYRDLFVKTMNTKEARDAGFPDVAQARIAATHPSLMELPNYAGGQSMAKMTGEVFHGSKGFGLAPHYTYPSKLGGEYAGGLPGALPKELLWRDLAPKIAARNPSAVGKIWLTGLKGEPFGQLVDRPWQDAAADYFRKNPMGALASPHYQQ